jgi:outer membrane protein assembly factor BamB
MKRFVFLCLWLFLLTRGLLPQEISPKSNTLYVVWISDTHLGFKASNEAFQNFLKDVATLPFKPDWLINTGDIAELGDLASDKAYLSGIHSLGIPAFATMGNHDTRWCSVGKKRFKAFIGQRYFSKDFGGIHWIFLDSTLERQAYGHIDFREMHWLKQDLKHVSPHEPIFTFSHHPFKWRGVDVDDGLDLLNLYDGHEAPAFFNGHGHKLEIILFRNTPFIENDALFHGNYVIFKIADGDVQLFIKEIGDSKLQPWFSFSLHPPLFSSFFLLPKPDAVVGKTFQVVLKSAFGLGKLLLDHKKDIPLQADEKMLKASISLDEAGWHTLDYFLPGQTLPTDEEQVFFPGEKSEGLPKISRVPLGEIYAGLQTNGKLLFGGTLGGTFFAVNKQGSIQWEKKLDGAVMSTPAFANEKVFVGTNGGSLYAFQASNGKKIWEVHKRSPFTNPPLIFHHTVYLDCGNKKFYAFDEATGKEKWSVPLGDFAEDPAVGEDGKVFIGTWNHTFYALDAQSGKVLWKINIGKSIYYSPSITTPLLVDGNLYIAGKDYKLHALDPKTGKEKWSVKVLGGISSPLFVYGKILVPQVGGIVKAFDPSDGKKLWEHAFRAQFFNASPIAVKKIVFLPAVNGMLFIFDVKSKKLLQSVRISRGFVFSTPVFLGGKIWIGSLDGFLYSFPLKSLMFQ